MAMPLVSHLYPPLIFIIYPISPSYQSISTPFHFSLGTGQLNGFTFFFSDSSLNFDLFLYASIIHPIFPPFLFSSWIHSSHSFTPQTLSLSRYLMLHLFPPLLPFLSLVYSRSRSNLQSHSLSLFSSTSHIPHPHIHPTSLLISSFQVELIHSDFYLLHLFS